MATKKPNRKERKKEIVDRHMKEYRKKYYSDEDEPGLCEQCCTDSIKVMGENISKCREKCPPCPLPPPRTKVYPRVKSPTSPDMKRGGRKTRRKRRRKRRKSRKMRKKTKHRKKKKSHKQSKRKRRRRR